MPIPDIRLNNIRISDIIIPDVPRWMSSDPPVALPAMPPVTMQLGTPIVNIPGCVEAHKDNQENVNLKEADDKGIMTLCDAGTPYYTAIDYDRNKIKLEQEPPKPPAYKAPPAPEAPETKTPAVPKTEAPMPECPTREQQLKNPVGKILEGNKKITGYEMVGKECLMVTEQLSIPDQIIGNIPNAGAVTIANDAVEQAMIADDAVGADQLASSAVVTASIVADAEGIILRNEQAISPVNPDGNVKFAFALESTFSNRSTIVL